MHIYMYSSFLCVVKSRTTINIPHFSLFFHSYTSPSYIRSAYIHSLSSSAFTLPAACSLSTQFLRRPLYPVYYSHNPLSHPLTYILLCPHVSLSCHTTFPLLYGQSCPVHTPHFVLSMSFPAQYILKHSFTSILPRPLSFVGSRLERYPTLALPRPSIDAESRSFSVTKKREKVNKPTQSIH